MLRFGLAFVIGVLVGLQREYSQQQVQREMFAGARTLALIALSGCTAAFIADSMNSPWVLVAVFLSVAGLIAISYFVTASKGDIGLTSEMAAILVFLVGVLCYWGWLEIAAALGVGIAVLLSLKVSVRTFVGRMTQQDVLATLKFAVITAIILPLLPNRTVGPAPLDVLNPQNIWLMVVFISAISFVGYVLIKLIGPRRGVGVTGLLGGLVSSTAVTLSFTQKSRTHDRLAKSFALAITVAWTMMFARVLVVTAVLNGSLLVALWIPMGGAGAIGLLYCGYLMFFAKEEASGEDVTLKVPFELGPALRFAIAYAAILVISRGSQMLLGDVGVYASAALSGIADVDAITLSMARMAGAGSVEIATASKAIVLAALVNTTVKGCIVFALGASALRKSILPAVVLILATGFGLMLWM